MQAGQSGDADEPERHAGQAHPGHAFGGDDLGDRGDHEDRNRRVTDGRDARIYVPLAPCDQGERHGVQHAQHQAGQAARRRSAQPARPPRLHMT